MGSFIVFNGVSSEDLHMVVQHPPVYSFPEKDYDFQHVPGRSGDVLIDNHSYQNVERKYDCAIDARENGYTDTVSAVVAWLTSANGYCRLEDSYEPEYFRFATFKDSGEISNLYKQVGIFDLKFDCKPQRYLKFGEEPIHVLVSSFKVKNPTLFYSKPIIRVTGGSGTGAITVNNTSMILHEVSAGMEIDCETQDVYRDQSNMNSKVLIDSFPDLRPGENTISLSGGVTSVDIIPRWWTL